MYFYPNITVTNGELLVWKRWLKSRGWKIRQRNKEKLWWRGGPTDLGFFTLASAITYTMMLDMQNDK